MGFYLIRWYHIDVWNTMKGLKMDWKSRVKNPVFWIGLVGVIGSPILAYNGLNASDLTTWSSLGDIILGTVQNPFLLCSVGLAVLGAFGVVVDPSSPGLGDGQKKSE